MKKLLFLFLLLSTFAQGQVVPPIVRSWSSPNSPGGVLKLDSPSNLVGRPFLGSGDATSTSYLRGDGVWATPPTGSGGGSSTGDVITWSASAIGLVADGTDQTAALQAAFNNPAYNTIWFNNSTASIYTINGTVTVPGNKMIRFEPGNLLTTSAQTASGTIAASGRTITGSGTTFTTSLKVGYKLTYQAVTGVAKTSGGSGYSTTTAPTYTLTGGGGTGAVIEAVISSDGTMSGWRLIDAGYGYTSAPTLTRTDGGSGSGAAGTVSIGPKIFGVVESIASNTSLTLRVPVKNTLSAIPLAFYGGVLSGAVISASLEHNICTPLFTLDCQSADWQASVNWYGAVPNDGFDDYVAMQKCIDDVTFYKKIGTVRLGVGNYLISKGLLFRIGNTTGAATPYCNTNFIGAGTYYDANLGGGSKITLTNGQSFGVAFQRCKGNIVSNIELLGLNQLTYSDDECFSDTATFALPGVRDNFYSPHAGWVVDPFASAGVDDASRYPDFKEYYTETDQGGSTKLLFSNLKTSCFVINYCNSLLQQNGEDMTFFNCISTSSKVGFGIYTSQAINCRVQHCQIWKKTKFAFDSGFPQSGQPADCQGYGQGGQMYEIDDVNLQGVKWVLRVASSSNTSRLSKVRCEVVYGIGGSFSTNKGYAETRLIADQWWANFAGTHAENSSSVCPQYMANFQDISFTNSDLIQFERPGNPYNFKSQTTSFVNCRVQQPLGLAGAQIAHFMTRWNGASGDRFNGAGNGDGRNVDIVVSSSATVASVNQSDSSWKYIIPSSGDIQSGKTITIGDRVDVFSNALPNEFHYGSAVIIPLGNVAAYNSGTREVTVKYLAYGITAGLLLNSVYIRH